MGSHKKDHSNSSCFINRSLGSRHSFYISGILQSPQEYTDMIHVIRSASESDEIIIHINSEGGNLFSAIQLMRAMAESDAMITTSVEGACMSAATMIFLAGHQYVISDHSIFMFHNYSSGAFGKGGELFDMITHERQWSRKLLESVYEQFLTDQEINSILDNKDIYMDSDEVAVRLNKRLEYFQEKEAAEESEQSAEPALAQTKEAGGNVKPKKKEIQDDASK